MRVIASVERCISAATSLLDFGFKLRFVNSVLSPLVVYAMCSIRIPHKNVEHLDKLRRRCFWNKQTEDGPIHNSLAAWDMICRPKNKGGLGIIDLKVQNMGLLLKQLFKFYNKSDVPWVQLMWNYARSVPHASDACGSFWWRDLMHMSDMLRGVTRVEVGNGSSVLFWKDLWHEQPIVDSHPRAFPFTINEYTFVQTFLRSNTIGEVLYPPLMPRAREEIRDLQQITSWIDPGSNVNDK